MNMRSLVLKTMCLYILCTVVFPSKSHLTADTMSAQGSPTEIGTAMSFAEGGTSYGFGIGRKLASSVGFGAYYTLIVPKGSDNVKLHSFGGALKVTLLTTKQKLPIDLSVIGSAYYMVAAGLPVDNWKRGQTYIIGPSFERFIPLGGKIAIAATISPLWMYSRSESSIYGSGHQEEDATINIWSIGFSIMIRDVLSLTPNMAIGKDFTTPGFSVVVLNSVSLGTSLAICDDTTTPSFSLGLIIK